MHVWWSRMSLPSQEPTQAKSESSSLLSFHIGISWSTTGAGGSGRVYADLARYLPPTGVQFSGAVSAPADVSQQTGGEIESFAPASAGMASRLFGARKVVLAAFARKKPDIVASHFALYTVPIADHLRRHVHVVHFHGPWAAESKQEGGKGLSIYAKKQVEKAVYLRANRVIVLSRAFADVATREYGVPEDQIRIVPGAADIGRFNVTQSRYDAREMLGWPSDRRILVSVRRLVSRMGLDRLIAALPTVVRSHPDILLCIVGKGRLREQLEAQVVSLNLQNHVRFQGFVPDEQIPLVYRAADLNIVPTLALEGFGLVAAEALAAGTPSMVTPIGGLPEVVSDLSNDLLFASAETADIAEGLQRFASGSLVLPDAQACYQYAANNFSVELMASRTAAVYREAVAKA